MKTFRRILLVLVLVALVTSGLIALGYALENWHGARRWAATCRELEARGESLDWSHFIPPPVPDDQNLALAPFYMRQLAYRHDPRTGRYVFGPPSSYPADLWDTLYSGGGPMSHQPSGWDFAVRTDLSAYARYYRQQPGYAHPDQPGNPAADVLTALARFAPALAEISHAAAERPLTRFPVRWDTENAAAIHIPHDNLQARLITILRLRASARLAASQPANALADVELALRLCQYLGQEPLLIAHLVQAASLRATLTPVWEGLRDRRWSDSDLARLQRQLQSIDLLANFLHVMRGERAVQGRLIDYFARHPGEIWGLIETLQSDGPHPQHTLFRAIAPVFPAGWFDENKATIARCIQTYEVESVDLPARVVVPEKAVAADRAMRAMPYLPTTVFAKIVLPVYIGVSLRTAQAQAGLDEAVVACALERFFLDHQSYPARLAELVPGYVDRVPTDLVDGSPLRYTPTRDGRYRLYEIGWNRRDDGGQIARWKDKGRINDAGGDWVWQYEPVPTFR